MKKEKINRFLPLILAVFVAAADQISKALIIKNIPENHIGKSYFNDFLWIVHQRNPGILWSIGAGFSDLLRQILFILLPLILVVAMTWLVLSKKNPVSKAQRWCCAAIIGGGTGNLIDRIFRFDTGVVDFISVKFYGLFGMDRWPTFNIGDSCVVVGVILFVCFEIFTKDPEKK